MFSESLWHLSLLPPPDAWERRSDCPSCHRGTGGCLSSENNRRNRLSLFLLSHVPTSQGSTINFRVAGASLYDLQDNLLLFLTLTFFSSGLSGVWDLKVLEQLGNQKSVKNLPKARVIFVQFHHFLGSLWADTCLLTALAILLRGLESSFDSFH